MEVFAAGHSGPAAVCSEHCDYEHEELWSRFTRTDASRAKCTGRARSFVPGRKDLPAGIIENRARQVRPNDRSPPFLLRTAATPRRSSTLRSSTPGPLTLLLRDQVRRRAVESPDTYKNLIYIHVPLSAFSTQARDSCGGSARECGQISPW